MEDEDPGPDNTQDSGGVGVFRVNEHGGPRVVLGRS
jgi:hypothetical protein